MAKRLPTPDEFDSPWKEALQVFLPAFLDFLFPDIHADVDWSRGYEALDKEFQKIAKHAKVGKQFVDKLFKVWLHDGAEHWLHPHRSARRSRAGFSRTHVQLQLGGAPVVQ